MKAREAYHHFCVRENRILERYQRLLPLVEKDPSKRARLGRRLRARHEAWWKRQTDGSPAEDGRYRRGNGAKILKWTWRLLREYGEQLDDDELLWATKLDPGLRPSALDHLTHSAKPHFVNSKILEYFHKGTFVDDYSVMSYSTFLINTRFRRTPKHGNDIRAAVQTIEQNPSIGVACAIQVLAKYGSTTDILGIGRRRFAEIRRDYYAARALAACFPRFLGSSDFNQFIYLVRGLDNEAAESVLDFHMKLHQDAKFAMQQYPFLRAPNPSIATGINLSKALMLLTAKHNGSFTVSYAKARSAHTTLSKDPYYVAAGL
jgi:hypothetical protein